jgi:hypothetical protein
MYFKNIEPARVFPFLCEACGEVIDNKNHKQRHDRKCDSISSDNNDIDLLFAYADLSIREKNLK